MLKVSSSKLRHLLADDELIPCFEEEEMDPWNAVKKCQPKKEVVEEIKHPSAWELSGECFHRISSLGGILAH